METAVVGIYFFDTSSVYTWVGLSFVPCRISIFATQWQLCDYLGIKICHSFYCIFCLKFDCSLMELWKKWLSLLKNIDKPAMPKLVNFSLM